MLFSFCLNKSQSLGLLALCAAFFISGCKAGVISVSSSNPSPKNPGHVISSTRENLATAGGVAILPTAKIKFTMGYLPTGNFAGLPTSRVRSTSAGVANEQ